MDAKFYMSRKITYLYVKVRQEVQSHLGSKFTEFLSAAAILRHHFQEGRLSGQTLYHTIVSVNSRLKMIAVLFSHDDDADGHLTIEEVTAALTEIAGICYSPLHVAHMFGLHGSDE